jgi:hypothetical protein
MHHGEGAGVMLNHELEKETIEFRAASRVELLHLIRGQHTRHQHDVLGPAHLHLHARRIGIGHRQVSGGEPPLHSRNLILLRVDDALGQALNRGTGSMRRRPPRHFDCLGVVRDHVGHEVDVGRGIGAPNAVGLSRRGCGIRRCLRLLGCDGLWRRRGRRLRMTASRGTQHEQDGRISAGGTGQHSGSPGIPNRQYDRDGSPVTGRRRWPGGVARKPAPAVLSF